MTRKILSEGLALIKINRTINKQVAKNESVIYGGQAIRKQIGYAARPTDDFDILSKKPLKSALELEKKLDRQSGSNMFFTKPAKHEGTYKVIYKGADRQANTYDDKHIADFTKPERKHKTKLIDGVKYVTLSEVKKDKRKAIRDPTQEFRHAKDKSDLSRIKFAKQNNIKYRRY